MVPSLLESSSILLTTHPTVGCSTGSIAGLRNDWPALIDEAAQRSSFAIELSALSEDELPGLAKYLGDAPQLPFRFVSVHGPSKGRKMDDSELVEALVRFPRWIAAIVMHPDTMDNLEPYRRLGRRLSIENMDTRKAIGQTAGDLERYFTALPDARLCFDLAHAKAVDPSMIVGSEILARYSSRLSHVHLSSLNESQHHVPLTSEDQALFADLLSRCSDVPWILEAAPS